MTLTVAKWKWRRFVTVPPGFWFGVSFVNAVKSFVAWHVRVGSLEIDYVEIVVIEVHCRDPGPLRDVVADPID
jgi:hypothetical protein